MTAGMGPVLIVEPNMDGHRFNYVRMLVEECQRERAAAVVLTTPAGKENYLRKSGGRSLTWEIVPDGSKIRPKELETVSRRWSATLVVVPDGDRTALAFFCRPVWRGSGDLRLLIMRAKGQAARPWIALAKTVLRRFAFAVVDLIPRVTTLTLRSALAVEDHRRRHVADPIEFDPTQEARRTITEALGGSDGRFWFGVAGWLDARKNIPLVLTALKDAAPRTDRPLGLLLAGQQDSTVREHLSSASTGPVRVAQINRHLTSAELDATIAVSDCMVMAHSNDGPSGILGKAAAAGTQVIAAGSRSLASDCRRLGSGTAQWVPLDSDALADAAVIAAQRTGGQPFPVASPTAFATAVLGT